MQTTIINLHPEINDLYVTDSGIFSYNGTTSDITKTDDYGETWQLFSNLKEEIRQNQGFEDMKIESLQSSLLPGRSVVYTSFWQVNENNGSVKIWLFFSKDSGMTWELTEGNMFFPEYYHVIDNNLYVFSRSLHRKLLTLDMQTKSLIHLYYDYNFMPILQYTKSDNNTYVVVDTFDEPLWVGDDTSMEKVEKVGKAWLDKPDAYYYFEEGKLFYSVNLNETILEDSIRRIEGKYLKSGHLSVEIEKKDDSKKELIFYRGKKIDSYNSLFSKAVYVKDEKVYGFSHLKDDEYRLYIINFENDKFFYLEDKLFTANTIDNLSLDVDDNVIITNSNTGIEISKDVGKNWQLLPFDEEIDNLSPKIFKEAYFIQNGSILLRSLDGYTWENILEGTSNSKIIRYEFDQQGRILVYTINGTFRSKEPVSVEDNSEYLADIDINIYPNPATDQLRIETNEKINGVEIYNLSGELLKAQSSLNVDTTELPVGTYFIKMQMAGKAVYKQFVVER